MNDQPDTLEISQTMTDIAESSQNLVADFLARQSGSAPGSAPGAPATPAQWTPITSAVRSSR